jgi:hypothetical protein
MALKGDRNVVFDDISFFSSATSAMTRGGIASLSTAGSGAALDQSNAVVEYAAAASGAAPIGLLLEPDTVNLDTSRYPLNREKLEQRLGAKVHLLKQGWVVTNSIISTAGGAQYGAPIAGSGAFLSCSGNVEVGPPIVTSILHEDGYYQPKVGTFLSTVDEDGYCKLQVNL